VISQSKKRVKHIVLIYNAHVITVINFAKCLLFSILKTLFCHHFPSQLFVKIIWNTFTTYINTRVNQYLIMIRTNIMC